MADSGNHGVVNLLLLSSVSAVGHWVKQDCIYVPNDCRSPKQVVPQPQRRGSVGNCTMQMTALVDVQRITKDDRVVFKIDG